MCLAQNNYLLTLDARVHAHAVLTILNRMLSAPRLIVLVRLFCDMVVCQGRRVAGGELVLVFVCLDDAPVNSLKQPHLSSLSFLTRQIVSV